MNPEFSLLRGYRRLARIAACLLLGALAPIAASAQQRSSSSDVELLRNLSPSQQRQIIDQMRKGRSSRRTQSRDTLDLDLTPLPKAREDDETESEVPRRTRLRGGDTVVIDILVREAGDMGEQEFEAEERRAELAERAEHMGRDAEELTPEEEQAMQAQRAAGSITQEAERRRVEARRDRQLERQKERERDREYARTPEQERRLKDFRLRVLDGNPYRLDKTGTLNVPGIAAMALAGLTDREATKRLRSEPALRDFRVRLTRLPLEKQGVDALEPYGYDLFTTTPSTFAPVDDVPVPSDYVVGAGDVLMVQLFGSEDDELSLEVSRSGEIALPRIGPVSVGGMRFSDARERIASLVAERMIGTRASVSMAELRAVQVFITGDAELPGAYTVSPLSTITTALFSSGGVKKIGSLRDIQLRRGGAIVARLDLYDLLLRGDARSDLRLLSGDVIFVPPVGTTAGVAGEVLRPAIYELRAEDSAEDLVRLAGGFTPEADPRFVSLERIDAQRERRLVDLDLASSEGRAMRLRTGDVLQVLPVSPIPANGVRVSGHVHREATLAWREGLRIADVLPNARALRLNADLRYVLVRREAAEDRHVSAVSADLEAAWRDPAGPANLVLAPRDEILVFDLEGGRERVLEPILDDLRRQARLGEPAQIVSIGGRVRAPGDYPLEPGMTVADLLRAGGGPGEAAYGSQAELTRHVLADDQARRGETFDVDLGRVLGGDGAADLELRPHDYLVVRELPQWAEQQTVMLKGEVRFPGRYPIKRGETLSSLMRRAGGLTDLAFSRGSVFTRDSLRERELRQIESLADRLEREISAVALQTTQIPTATPQRASDAVIVGESLLEALRDAKPVGRLVIDLERAMNDPRSTYDVMLKDGDELIVPAFTQEVTVLGEVQMATSHLYRPDLARSGYIDMSGGTTAKADEERTYIVRADGSVAGATGRFWFQRGGAAVQPGDTIVVPLDADRIPALPLWQAVTTIVYNLAVAAAAVNSF